MKKTVLRRTVTSVIIIAVVILMTGYTLYDGAGNYLTEQVLASQVTEDFTQKTGIDLSEAGRALTKEEVETVKNVLPKKEKQPGDAQPKEDKTIQPEEEVITTDDLKETLQKEVKEVVNVIPSTDKRAMTSLVMGNLTSGDINYLVGLVIDGVSGSDLAEAKRIAKEKFEGKELEMVKGYYKQYKHLLP